MNLVNLSVAAMTILIVSTMSPLAVAATENAPVQSTSAKKSVSEQFSEMKASVAGHLRVGVSVNTAGKMSGIHIKNQGATVGSAEANTGNTPALELQWVNRLYDGPGATKYDWFAGMTLERERAVSTLNMKATGSGTSQPLTIGRDQSPTFYANLLTAGLRWTPLKNLYLPLALNYGFLSRGTWGTNGTFDIDPALGLTFGAGYRLTPQLEFEAVYKIVRYNITLKPTGATATGTYFDGEVDLSGVVVAGRYIF